MFRFPYRPAWFEPPVVAPHRPSLIARFIALFSRQQRARRVLDKSPRPMVSIRIHGPVRARHIKSAVLDTGSRDTLFPMWMAQLVGIPLGGERRAITWRGTQHWVEFHDVDLEVAQAGVRWRWRARVGFTAAPLPLPLLGHRGCLDFFDAKFCGADQFVELEPNRSFPGRIEQTG
jgi:hypothetical protein